MAGLFTILDDTTYDYANTTYVWPRPSSITCHSTHSHLGSLSGVFSGGRTGNGYSSAPSLPQGNKIREQDNKHNLRLTLYITLLVAGTTTCWTLYRPTCQDRPLWRSRYQACQCGERPWLQIHPGQIQLPAMARSLWFGRRPLWCHPLHQRRIHPSKWHPTIHRSSGVALLSSCYVLDQNGAVGKGKVSPASSLP